MSKPAAAAAKPDTEPQQNSAPLKPEAPRSLTSADLDPKTAARRQLAEALAAPATKSVRRTGLIAGGLFLVLVVGASFLPIASGVVAIGQLAAEGSRKVLQHPMGGVIAEILVKEGQGVRQGDVLLRLDTSRVGPASMIVNAQVYSLRAEEAARTAEASGADSVTFPQDLLDRAQKDPAVAAIVATQRSAYEARRAQLGSRRFELAQQLTQLEQRQIAARAQEQAAISQLSMLRDEAESFRGLFEKGLAAKSRLLQLERAVADTEGQVTSLGAEQRRLDAQMAEVRAQLRRLDFDSRAQAADQLARLRQELTMAMDRKVGTDDTLKRADLTAPVDGQVVGLRVNTIGGVIEPGAPIMEIVPSTDQMVVKARVRPQDADDVIAGAKATVRFDALGVRNAPRVEGVVETISADALNDQRTGQPYFEVRVLIPPEAAKKLPPEVLSPGLPAEVLINTGSRTAVQYFFAPIDRLMFEGLREQ